MRRADERGSALLVALGMLVLLSIMGITFVILTRMEMQASINFDNITRARFLAETGLERAIAELRALYVGPPAASGLTEAAPLFRPRFDRLPPDTGLLFRISKPYGSTVAAQASETWGARAIDVSALPTYNSLDSMLMPTPPSADSAPYLWSGPQRGRLSEGYFDTRWSATPKQMNGGVVPPFQTFRIVRGVVDLSGLVNVNRVKQQTLEGLLTYFNIANPGTVAGAIITSRDPASGGFFPFRYVRELVDRGVLTVAQLYGEDANGNGVLDPGEDTNGNGVLDGALKDVLTVYPMTQASYNPMDSAINVNAAPEPVLFAVFYKALDGDTAKALGLARAVIAYRAGADRIEGPVSERDPNGDGTANPTDLTGDGTTNDLYCDDNPFDGIFDGVLYPAIIPGAATWLPEFAVAAGEWQDIDGDTVPPELVAGTHPSFDRWLFPNGPGGFSEFEYFMDNVNAWFGLTLDTSPGGDVDKVKKNATMRADLYKGANVVTPTATFRYDSECWLVTAEGRVERGGELRAVVTLSAVVGYQ